jgi:hypothetical protein
MAMPKRPRSREEEDYLLESTQPSSRTYDTNIDTHPDRDYDEAKEALLSKHRSQYPGAYSDDTDETLAEEPGTSWKLKSSPDAKNQGRKRRRRMIFGSRFIPYLYDISCHLGETTASPCPAHTSASGGTCLAE